MNSRRENDMDPHKLDTEDLKLYLGGISCMDLIAEGIDPVQFVKEDWIRQV